MRSCESFFIFDLIINPNVQPYNFVYITILEYERVESILIGLYIRLCYKRLISSYHDVSDSLLVFTLKPRALFRVDFPGKKKKKKKMPYGSRKRPRYLHRPIA